jgi:hypothetical protein
VLNLSLGRFNRYQGSYKNGRCLSKCSLLWGRKYVKGLFGFFAPTFDYHHEPGLGPQI